MRPGPARPIPIAMSSGGAVVLFAVAIRETSGTAGAVIRLRNGTDANGEVVVPISLNPGESIRDSWPNLGVIMEGGLFPELVSGSIEGAYFIRDWSDEGIDYDWQMP